MAAAALAIVLGFCLFISETRPSLLLEREAMKVRKELPHTNLKILNPDAAPDLKALMTLTLVRPVRLLCTEPIIMAVAFMGSVTCALFYLQAESIPLVFEAYGWNTATASLGFIPILLGCLASFITRFHDHAKLAGIKASGAYVEPEDKLTGFTIAAPCLAGGQSNSHQDFANMKANKKP